MVKPRRSKALRNCAYSRRRFLSSTGRSNMANSHMARYPERAKRPSGMAKLGNLDPRAVATHHAAERKGRARQPIEQSAALLLAGEPAEQRFQQRLLRFTVQSDGLSFLLQEFRHDAVNQGPERLHQIVGQTEGVVAVVVMQAESRVEAGGADGARHGRAQDGIAIVQERVWPFAFRRAAEALPK